MTLLERSGNGSLPLLSNHLGRVHYPLWKLSGRNSRNTTTHESMWWRSADQSTQNLKSWKVYSFIRTWPILAGVRNNGTNAWLPSTALAFMGADQVGGPLIRGLSFALHSSSRHMQIQTLSICLADQVAALISVCNAFAPQCEKGVFCYPTLRYSALTAYKLNSSIYNPVAASSIMEKTINNTYSI